MIGLGGILRILSFAFYFALGIGLLTLVVKVLNLGVQWIGNLLGYEVGDFLSWVWSKLPKRKHKRTPRSRDK
jgi:hypothetical protein